MVVTRYITGFPLVYFRRVNASELSWGSRRIKYRIMAFLRLPLSLILRGHHWYITLGAALQDWRGEQDGFTAMKLRVSFG